MIFLHDLNHIFGPANTEIWFFVFLEKLQIIKFSFKDTNPESIEIMSKKLQTKHQTAAEDDSEMVKLNYKGNSIF